MSDFPPSIVAGKLSERTSEKGNVYLTGFFGSMKITALKTKDVDDKGQPIWNLVFAEAQKRDKASGDKPTGTVAGAQAKGTPAENGQSDFGASAIGEHGSAPVAKPIDPPVIVRDEVPKTPDAPTTEKEPR